MSGEIWRLSPCTVILEVGYTTNWGCLSPAVEVGCGEALPLYNLQHLCAFRLQGCDLFPREIYPQGTIVKAPWKSTQPFPSPYPVLLAHRVVLIFCNAKHNREGTQHKSQGQIMQSPPPGTIKLRTFSAFLAGLFQMPIHVLVLAKTANNLST